MKERIIFHADINHCYAQIEEMLHPEYRKIPMAVGGHEEKRHGIILAKNDLAKKEGIKTAESLREARAKCRDLLIIPPHYQEYIYYTNEVKNIYRRYSDQVESFGLDEAWIDYTDSEALFGDPIAIAHRIQDEVLHELGLTISIGISWNKVFAKFGSDLVKPSGFTVITKENYKDIVWPAPVEDLMFVGPATMKKLHSRAIYTIGDLAQYKVCHLKKYLGIAGEVIHAFANGEDAGVVAQLDYSPPIKSVGNAVTMIHDVGNLEELKPVYIVLCESVASRLKDAGLEATVISIAVRTAELGWFSCQKKIADATDVSMEIFSVVMELLQTRYSFEMPVRAAGVSVSGLRAHGSVRQLSFLIDEDEHEEHRLIDEAVDEIRGKYGFKAVCRACTLMDAPLTDFNPKGEHTVHPVGYFQGRKML